MKLVLLVAAVLALLPGPLVADGIDPEMTWARIRGDGKSLVFGRLQGRFDGAEYRGRRLRVRHEETGREHELAVEPGLGYFEAVLPTGRYSLLSIEATYFPQLRPLSPEKFPPVGQRYVIRPIPGVGQPSFPVSERPVYLGTVVSVAGDAGLVYEGHQLRLVDEFDRALARFRSRYAQLDASLRESDVQPMRYFFLEPVAGPLSAASDVDPVDRARDYLRDGKFEQALRWLETMLPSSDRERAEVRLLVGEALLGQKRYAEAIEQVGEALLAEPENARALRLLARAHALRGDREDALNLYRALAGYLPVDAEANLHLGYHFALTAETALAKKAFDAAFQDNFDYLLHDVTPYALALSAADASYEPASIQEGLVRIPRSMRSRRGTRGGFGLLIDHEGRVLAAHLTPDAEGPATTALMALVRAKFTPARLNGVRVPCLVIFGEGDLAEPAR